MLLWKLALKNLFVHRLKTLVIGLIIVFGTTLAIVGNSVVDAISGGMQRSLTHSITGDIQVYAADAKEKLAILGSMDGNMPDIGHHPNFARVREALLKLPNVKAVVPMGVNSAYFTPGNLLDIKLEELRQAYQLQPRPTERIESLKEHVQAIVREIERSQNEQKEHLGDIYEGEELFKTAPEDIAKALSPSFWQGFDAQHEQRQEFLANKLAPLIFDDNMLYLSYLGTSPELFRKSFSQFEIAKGEMIPEGQRGFLFSDYIYETQVKHRVARRLDQIKKQRDQDGLKIHDSKELQDRINANVEQAAEIYTQMEPPRLRELLPKLKTLLGSSSEEAPQLLKEFLTMDDKNFDQRHDFFYREIAPHVLLYRVRVGDTFVLTAFGKSGYSTSVKLKVYGTYKFKSFESSPLAGSMNIMDLVSFRQLYGFMTPDMRAETQALDKEMGLEDISRDDIESLFGETLTESAPEPKYTAETKTPNNSLYLGERSQQDPNQLYSREEIEDGVFLNAAVLLKNPDHLASSMEKIRDLVKDENLGLQAVDWKESAGIIGQLTILVRGLLYLFVLIIFAVATFIIMNSMLMATLERKREIGTMRAIGAPRAFLMGLFLRETFVLSFVFGGVGTLLGVIIILVVGSAGIPAMGDVATFFFSGDRLYLSVNPLHMAIVFACMTLVALVSTQYPAWKAMKISPLEAMQHSD